MGKQLKKNGIAVDVVSLGEVEANQEKLQEFVDAANSACLPSSLTPRSFMPVPSFMQA